MNASQTNTNMLSSGLSGGFNDLSVDAAPSMMSTTTGGARKSAATKKSLPKKMTLCGRERLVYKEGRSCYVTINKEKVPLSKAKEMDKVYKKEKKEKTQKSKRTTKRTKV
jgi:ABC-type xylose transport system substrate-binding protein